MKQEDKLVQTILQAVHEFNQDIPKEDQLDESIDAVLFGESGKLDSLGLVNLILLIEEKIDEEYGLYITIADERALSQEKSPFKTIRRLAGYTCLLLEEQESE